MATNLLTDRAILAAKPKDREYELTDGGGLALRVKTNGTKMWAVRFTSPTTGKRLREYIGAYPGLRLADARQKAAERKSLVAKGISPDAASLLLSEHAAAPSTVGDLFDLWFRKYVIPHRSSADDQASIKSRFENYVRPKIGGIALGQVRRGQLMTVIDTARDAQKLRTANLLLGELGQMFRYAAAREWMQGDPTAGISRKDAGGQDNESDRVLDDAELLLLRDILSAPPRSKSRYYTAKRRVLPPHTELAVWWTLATLGRAVEVATIKRTGAVNRKAATWTIPAEIAKNKKSHVVHLSAFALAVWDRLFQLPSDGEYVFQGRDGGHLSETEVTRRLTDRQTRAKPVKGRKNSTILDLPGGHWTQHDLRRTGATIMGELGISSDVIDLCLNHKKAKKTTRTYQRQTMLPQRKEAFDALGAHLTQLLGSPEAWLPQVAPAVEDT
ncbi:tyrosine-type recombinase/integrase [Achromobacter xylosoxidans]|uniref:tyrosine-type recombinase/integrase n=1 Tax=Alcaligenes xylosoxydans xylosoxydans TaxID=85698 RepID=UPI001EED369A|nr:integrase arm-type DNA-binding domain-containing protein [Achromobacter xylosoxidans]